MALGDINDDGELDIVTANMVSDNVSVLIGDGAGGFTASTILTGGVQPYSVALGDIDGDGAIDIVVANRGSVDASLLLGDGDGAFSATVIENNNTIPSPFQSLLVMWSFLRK